MPENKASRVRFSVKASWQKDDCLFCSSYAVIQADFGKASIRCCENAGCKRKASKLAKGIGIG